MAVNKVVFGDVTLIDTSEVTVEPEKLVEGVSALNAKGERINGTNPYEKSSTDATVESQSGLIDQISAALEGKSVSSGGGGSISNNTTKLEALLAKANALPEVESLDDYARYCQMVQATIGNLTIKASDGNYYRINVDADGNVSAVLSIVTEDEIEAGITGDRRVILATDIAADSLSTSNLLATYALVNKINAAQIDVDQLFAREAFINKLSTSTIANGANIQMLIGKYGELSKWFIFDDEDGFTLKKPAYTDASGVAHPESIWRFRATETGIQIVRSDMPTEPVLKAEREQITTPSMQMGEILCTRTSTDGWVWADV